MTHQFRRLAFLCSVPLCARRRPPEQFKFALNEFNQIQPKKFKESVEFDRIIKTMEKMANF